MTIRVGVNGYGTVGRRVADAVRAQSDMTLVGVTKTRADYRARLAIEKGIEIYLPNEESKESFAKAKVAHSGTLADLLGKVDVIVDATPELGVEYKPLYDKAGVKAVFQGGEEHDLTGVSFVAQCDYDNAKGKRGVRVVSCNTTALCRTLHALDSTFGISKARAVLARRAADPDEVSKGPIDAIVPDPITVPSHHGPDVVSVMNGLNITTMAIKVPVTHMHLHSVMVTLKSNATKESVVSAFEKEPRIMLIDGKSGFKSTSQIIDWARERGRPRNDVYEATIWRDSVGLVDNEVYLFLAVNQEAIVTPENVDAIRAVASGVDRATSIGLTDASLGIKPPLNGYT